MTTIKTTHLEELVKTMCFLRAQNGCSWDREQTPESLRPYILEEAYELVDAIDSGDTAEILSELGDLLLQVVFQAQIFTEQGLFNLDDVARGINDKLRRRHPAIFSPGQITDKESGWEQIKQQELKERGKKTDFASRQPTNLPALKLADKCCRYLNKTSTLANIEQNTDEHLNPLSRPEPLLEEDLAEQLFNLVCQAQKQGIDSDLALRKYALKRLQKVNQSGCN